MKIGETRFVVVDVMEVVDGVDDPELGDPISSLCGVDGMRSEVPLIRKCVRLKTKKKDNKI